MVVIVGEVSVVHYRSHYLLYRKHGTSINIKYNIYIYIPLVVQRIDRYRYPDILGIKKIPKTFVFNI